MIGIQTKSLALSFSLEQNRTLNVFRDLALTINSGSFVSLIGESGCGKTSLLKILGGLLDPTSGEACIGDFSPKQARLARQVAFLFQSPVLLPWLTVEQNVALPVRLWQDEGLRPNVLKAIDLVGLMDFAAARPSQLSGGMQARAAIARALVQEPKVLLMDEPFGALDEIVRAYLDFELLKIWSESKPTVVFVTHSISEAVLLSDQVMVMGPRPAGILKIWEINLPRPRTSAMLDQPEFHVIVNAIRHQLNEISSARLNGRKEPQ